MNTAPGQERCWRLFSCPKYNLFCLSVTWKRSKMLLSVPHLTTCYTLHTFLTEKQLSCLQLVQRSVGRLVKGITKTSHHTFSTVNGFLYILEFFVLFTFKEPLHSKMCLVCFFGVRGRHTKPSL